MSTHAHKSRPLRRPVLNFSIFRACRNRLATLVHSTLSLQNMYKSSLHAKQGSMQLMRNEVQRCNALQNVLTLSQLLQFNNNSSSSSTSNNNVPIRNRLGQTPNIMGQHGSTGLAQCVLYSRLYCRLTLKNTRMHCHCIEQVQRRNATQHWANIANIMGQHTSITIERGDDS